jgi:hypothetical protein
MGKQKIEKKNNRKKEFREMIFAKLQAAFSDLKNEIDEKKFNAALKKANKLLSRSLYTKKKKEKKPAVQELSA